MLSPEYLESCADPLIKLYQDLEDQIIADIARRIAKTGTLTYTADWQYKVIREIGAVQQDIITRVSQMSGRTEEEIRRLFQESAFINIETNAAPLISNGYEVELDLTPPMRQLIEATFRRTAGDINNLTLTAGVTGGNLYYEMCNQAYMQAASGAFSPQEAIWNAVKGAAQEGATVQYPKRRDKLDVAIRRNIMTSLNQTAGKITEMNADQLGAEYYETSAHPGARPSHAAWQGRVFKIVGATREYPNFEESTGYGTAGGLCGINCRHSFYPFFPGLSDRAYSSDKLAWYRTHTVQYNGEDYTDYEASQIQRAMERSIRESKRRAIAAKAAEDGATDEETKKHLKEKFAEESSILKQKEKRLKEFLRQTGRDAENSRVRVPGFGRSISQKAVWANRRPTSTNSNTNESGSKQFNTYDDPIRERLGSAYKSHPDGVEQIKKHLSEMGVTVNEKGTNMNYGPSPIPGRPGRLNIDPEASYSAWLHEYEHAKQDERSGWNGILALMDPNEAQKWEDAAYDAEIDFAKKLGYDKIVKRLEWLKGERRREVHGKEKRRK